MEKAILRDTETETFEDPEATCEWCGERFQKSELQEEVDLGFLCRRCVAAITSHGEEIILKH